MPNHYELKEDARDRLQVGLEEYIADATISDDMAPADIIKAVLSTDTHPALDELIRNYSEYCFAYGMDEDDVKDSLRDELFELGLQ